MQNNKYSYQWGDDVLICVQSSDTCKWQNKNLADSLQIDQVTAYANMQCTTQYTLPYRK